MTEEKEFTKEELVEARASLLTSLYQKAEVKKRFHCVSHYIDGEPDLIASHDKIITIYYRKCRRFSTKDFSRIKRVWKREGLKILEIDFTFIKDELNAIVKVELI